LCCSFGLGSSPEDIVKLAALLPLISQLGTYLVAGMDHYADLREARKAADPETISFFLRIKLDGWDPEIKGRRVLDPETKDAAARFLAGVACNLAGVKS
jgi:hypothetical protein